MTGRGQLVGAGVILWVNYGSEGWEPRSYATPEEAISDLMFGCVSGEWILTKELPLKVVEEPEGLRGA